MAPRLVYAPVQDRPRKVIHVVRVIDAQLAPEEIHELAERMCQRALSPHGEQAAALRTPRAHRHVQRGAELVTARA